MGLSVGSWALRECKGRGRRERCDGQAGGGQGRGEGDVGGKRRGVERVGQDAGPGELDGEFAPWPLLATGV